MALEYFAMQRGLWWTQWLKVPRSFCCKTNPNNHISITTFDSLYAVQCSWTRLWFAKFRCNSASVTMLFFFCFASFKHRKGFLLATLQNKQYSFSLVLIVLSWILSFALLTVVCRVWDGIFALSDHSMVWHWGDFAGMLTPGNTGNHLQCFPLVDFLFTL